MRIFQQPKNPSEKPRYFKLKLFGSLPEKAVKNFWNLPVQREGSNLVVKESERLAYLGKKKPKKEKPQKGKPKKGKPQKEKPKISKDSQQPTPVSASPLPTERPKNNKDLQQSTPAAALLSPTERPAPKNTERPSPLERPAATNRPSPTERPAPLERPLPTERPLLKKKPDNISTKQQSNN